MAWADSFIRLPVEEFFYGLGADSGRMRAIEHFFCGFPVWPRVVVAIRGSTVCARLSAEG
jgi:hypothetical protein